MTHALPRVAAIVRAELTLRLRDPLFPILLLLVFAGCALLVPDPAAGYAVVTIDEKKPLMSADTALAAAAVVLGVLLFPVYALALDLGHARDRRLAVDRLHLTQPLQAPLLPLGRLAAGILFALLTAAFSLLVVSSTVLARYGAPSPAALLLFLLVVAPLAMLAAVIGGALDRWLPERNGTKTAVVFCLWMVAIGLAIGTAADAFGFRYLSEHTGSAGQRPQLSVGIIAAQNLATVVWTRAPLTAAFAADRLLLALQVAAAAVVLAFLLRFRATAAVASGNGTNEERWDQQGRSDLAHLSQPSDPPHPAGVLSAGWCIARRWLRRSRAAKIALVVALLLALRPDGAPGVAFAVALTIPMFLLSKTSVAETRVASTLESTTAALARPSPSLMHASVLALLVVIPALPALLRMPPLQLSTALLALVASTLWLVWTHRCTGRSLLGISIFAAIWYFDAFNDVPPAADVLGLWHSSFAALQIAAIAAGCMIILVGRHDRLLGATAGARA